MSSKLRPVAAIAATLVLSLALGAGDALAGARPHRGRVARHLAGTPVPTGFVGVNENSPLLNSGNGLSLADEFATMAKTGVQTVRVAFDWSDAQPYASWQNVPSGQAAQFEHPSGAPVDVPTDFSWTDQVVQLAALYRLRLLPVVLYAPGWDAAANPGGIPTPADPAPFANYLTALIARYGPHGSYWVAGQPRLPVRQWQIWNEPNIPYYWHQPSARGYVRLLSAAHAAIVQADPGARTVVGAITNYSWKYVGQLYRVRGVRSLFNVMAINPFTSTPARVVRILRLVRRVMDAHGDAAKQLMATEVGWTSAQGVPGAHFDWDTSEAGQARDVARLLPLLAADRRSLRLAAFYYYTWIGDESQRGYDFNFAGLFKVQNGQAVPKPAYWAFKRAARAIETR